ncbi:MAG TPA: DUF4423 domain-containing protein [Bacteriovoracaceae bacterium]|nr:DUF4423 domain-containing protein [Bacteriovoracaceae bacterium]
MKEQLPIHDPLVEILKKDFAQKKKRNGSFSLRAFAHQLDVDPSNLSKIFSYQLIPKEKLKKKLARKAGIEDSELLQLQTFQSTQGLRDSGFRSYELELFDVISDWYHYGILELVKLKVFKARSAWVSAALGISSETAFKAIERLKKTGLLEVRNGKYECADETSSSTISIATSKAHRNQQKQILELAITALEETDIIFRSQSSITMAIDRKRLPEARELIKEFRRSLSAYLTHSEDLNDVYNLSISLYPITKFHQEESK